MIGTRRGLFGRRNPSGLLAEHGGIVATPEQETEQRRMEAMFPNVPRTGDEAARIGAISEGMPQAKKPGFFDKGGAGQYVLAGISDFIDRRQGNQPGALRDMVDYQRFIEAQAAEQAAAQRAASLKRTQDREDWLFEQQWERANPKPANNDTANDYEFWRERLTPEQFQQWLQNNHINPSFYTGPDGRRYPNPTGGAPTTPVGRLTPITGGAGGNASGGF